MHLQRDIAVCAIIACLVAALTGCTGSNSQAQVSHTPSPSPTESVGTRPASQLNQLVVHRGGYYVRWRPGAATSPVRILPDRLMPALSLAASDHQLYWLQGIKQSAFGTLIRSMPSDGRRPITVARVGAAFGLAVSGDYVYWGAPGAIGRVSIDGTRAQRRFLVIPRQKSGDIANGLAADENYLYISQCFNGRIGRIPLNVREPHPRVDWIIHTDTCPQDIAVSDGYIYWGGNDGTSEGVIGRATLEGGRPNESWTRIRSAAGPFDIAVANGFVYWVWGGIAGAPSFLGRVSIDGGGISRKVLTVGSGPIAAIE